MFLFLGSIILRQKNELRALVNSTKGRIEQHGLEYNAISSIVTSSNETKKFCLTPDCVTVAASVIEAIDLTIDPCDDFYRNVEEQMRDI
jgi:ribose 5-phosphate isomerase